MSLQPIGEKLLVEEISGPTESAGGIVLPESMRKENQKGRVVAVGSGYILSDGTRRPLSVKVGDVVLFDKKLTIKLEHDGKEYFLMMENALLALEEE